MWAAAAPLPYYSEYHTSRRKGSGTTASKKDGSSKGGPAHPPPSAAVGASASATVLSVDMAALLEPAIDGPPSPERLRALNKQARQAANFEKNRSHNPSASSVHNSSERPWDHVLDNTPLSRRSSGRSTSSSMPSRERPDSVQILGKAIFGRKGKLKRDSSANSSSASSLYSGETPLETTMPTPPIKEQRFIPPLFGRRKAAKSDPWGDMNPNAIPTPVALKKQSISGPYNFQHVAHTRRDHVPASFHRSSRMGSVAELPTTIVSQNGIGIPDDSRFPDLPPESNYVTELSFGSNMANPIEPHTHIYLDRPPVQMTYVGGAPPRGGPRRLVKSSKSQEHLRGAPPRPPRPPRSPIVQAYHDMQPQPDTQRPISPPIPPPRLSSRQSIRYGGYDPLETTTLERPQTSGGFRQPEPFQFVPQSPELQPASAHSYSSSVDMGAVSDDYFHHAVTTPDDEAWPLTPVMTATSNEGALPDVPEEDEGPKIGHRPHGSVASNSSSIRRTRSVPLLRRSTQHTDYETTATRRPPSATSDTLGHFDLFAAQRALRASSAGDVEIAETPGRSSWEDDIDYCYENELEADCDYEWTRQSGETYREGPDTRAVYPTVSEPRSSPLPQAAPEPMSGLFLTPDNDDVPALSPASQVSLHEPEAITPTVAATPASSFSGGHPELRIHKQRPDSHASSFKESHGFTLSPSLLIPADFQQQMMLTASDAGGYDDGGPIILGDYQRYSDKAPAASHSSLLDRVSTSTLGTDSSVHSGASGDVRHVSTSTAYTRFTGVDELADDVTGSWSPKVEPVIPRDECSFVETLIPSFIEPLAPLSPSQPTAHSEIKGLAPESSMDLPRGAGRPRARTTSLATPQRAQFSLFPRSPSMRRL
ncbi:uncharacterized protein DNG_01391 [Cephalotrichum gorgonifer]|uniref:CRIB domain-containing protein n=1 Tax=Cephalotrichum gorgonifer TaxID=2041049 RepID=A0AAE8MR19_9PEZI|nr:uncharacterized protein DNG_01391 [Cephalotrichum gorgonifer]